jgi:biopolymer transport protein ExbB
MSTSNRFAIWLSLALVLTAWVFTAAPVSMQSVAAAAEEEAQEGEGGEQQVTESGIHWFLRCSGVIGLFIFGLSVYFVSVVIRMFMTMTADNAVPPELAASFRSLLGQGDFQTAYEMAKASDSFLGRVLTRGIEKLQHGMNEARHAMELAADAESIRMEKEISIMAVLGTLGPMIGLIGTLKGMIASFSVIAMSGVTLKPSEVAGGISEALLLTFEGVGLSIPAIYFFAFFRNRLAALSMDAILEAEDLIFLFSHSGQSKDNRGAAQQQRTAAPTR